MPYLSFTKQVLNDVNNQQPDNGELLTLFRSYFEKILTGEESEEAL
jgi:hypothetical protein